MLMNRCWSPNGVHSILALRRVFRNVLPYQNTCVLVRVHAHTCTPLGEYSNFSPWPAARRVHFTRHESAAGFDEVYRPAVNPEE